MFNKWLVSLHAFACVCVFEGSPSLEGIAEEKINAHLVADAVPLGTTVLQ